MDVDSHANCTDLGHLESRISIIPALLREYYIYVGVYGGPNNDGCGVTSSDYTLTVNVNGVETVYTGTSIFTGDPVNDAQLVTTITY